MTGLSPKDARELTLAEVIAWGDILKAEDAARRLAARRAARGGR
jgi:hypothetical protein